MLRTPPSDRSARCLLKAIYEAVETRPDAFDPLAVMRAAEGSKMIDLASLEVLEDLARPSGLVDVSGALDPAFLRGCAERGGRRAAAPGSAR